MMHAICTHREKSASQSGLTADALLMSQVALLEEADMGTIRPGMPSQELPQKNALAGATPGRVVISKSFHSACDGDKHNLHVHLSHRASEERHQQLTMLSTH